MLKKSICGYNLVCCLICRQVYNGPPSVFPEVLIAMAPIRNPRSQNHKINSNSQNAQPSRSQNNTNSNNINSRSNNLSRIQQNQNKGPEESINHRSTSSTIYSRQLPNPGLIQYQYFCQPAALNCINQFAYRNYSQPVAFQPHLHFNCFHRADFSNQAKQPNRQAAKNARVSVDHRMGGLRFWEKVTSHSGKSGFNFTVMSYNVLAQDLLEQHPQLYSLHNQNNLNWSFRWKNLLREIKDLSPDILCMQEVQDTHQYKYFSVLKTLGYKGIYKKRTGQMPDGCAIYYKTNLINLIEFFTVEYKQPNCQILDRNNVGIVARFAPKESPSTHFVVATTHLLYNPKRQDVRLAQTQLLLTEIERMAFTFSQKDKYLPVIITGDFNSKPESIVYRFITSGSMQYENLAARSLQQTQSGKKTGKVLLPPALHVTDQCQHADLLDRRQGNSVISRAKEWEMIRLDHSLASYPPKSVSEFSGMIEADRKLFSTGTLSHEFNLSSVYEHVSDGAVEGTTFQDEWLTVDYIFYSKLSESKLVLLDRYKLPIETQLGELKIPSSVLGSDHLSLLAKFRLNF